MTIIGRAYGFAKQKHNGQKDDCGEDYFDGHVCQVFEILNKLTEDDDILCAALLHDTIEDTNTTYEELIEHFGPVIADLVMEVTHEGKKDQIGFYFPRLKSQKAIMIKFADRLSNLSRMKSWPEDRKNQYLRKSKFWRDSGEKA